METGLITIDSVPDQLAASGLVYDDELAGLFQSQQQGWHLPIVRVEHSDTSSSHRFYLDTGESYLDGERITPIGDRVTGAVFAEQTLRALWRTDEVRPQCVSINDQPTCDDPITQRCRDCPESLIATGQCRQKGRLFIVASVCDEVMPVVINLPPTSLKHLYRHKTRLYRSGLPAIAVNTVFTLRDVQRNGFRYAEIHIGIDGLAPKPMLDLAAQARTELICAMGQVTPSDYIEEGDKIPF
ncbi:hypothetical protein ACFL5M_04125 [Candidatus Neomarinimicrobiota bacterium]